MLPSISRSKSKETMKFGQLVGCKVRNFFRHAENEAGGG